MTRTVRAPAAAATRVPRRMLLVTASLGGGHHAAARAVEEQARRVWPEVEVVWTDALTNPRLGTGRMFPAAYAGCVRRLPWLYGLYFWLLCRVPPFRAGTRAVLGRWFAPGLRRVIARHRPDLVVATVPEAVQGLGRLRRRGLLPMTAVALVADPAPHPLWIDAALDLHLVSTAAGAARAQRIAPGARVRVGALPVVAAFSPPEDPPVTGPRSRPRVYVSGGSLAFGDLPAACAAVLAGGAAVVVGCGRDPALRRRLQPLALRHPDRMEVREWIDDPAGLLRTCDAVVTNAGGATALEALACARPLLLFAPIPGHGRANAEVLSCAGLARICRTPEELAAAVACPLPPVRPPRRDAATDMAVIAELCRPREGPRVRPQDALFLHVAGGAQHIGACIVVRDEGRRTDWRERVAERVASRAPGIDLLCRRLAPPRPGRPLRWLLDPCPDPARHLRPGVVQAGPHVRPGVVMGDLAAPDGAGAFDTAMTAFLTEPLDPCVAAWELQVVRDGEHVAVLAKVHHALGDGLGLTDALLRLLADEPPRPAARGPDGAGSDGTDPDGRGPDGSATGPDGTDPAGTGPSWRDPNRTGPAGTGPAWRDPNGTDPDTTDPDARGTRRRVARACAVRACAALRGVASLARAGLAGPAPLGGPTEALRWVSLRFDGRRVRALARAYGVHTAALLLALIAEAISRLPSTRAGPAVLRAMVPVTTRTRVGVDSRAPGNRTAAVPLDLPVGPMAPVERVRLIAARMAAADSARRPEGAAVVLAAVGLLPHRAQAAVTRMVYGPRFFHAVMSVLPGTRRPRHIGGAPITATYPVLPLAEGIGLAVGAMHWRDATTIGITTTVPGLADGLPAAVGQALSAMEAAAGAGAR